MKTGKQILALFLSFWLLVGTIGYADTHPPLCCEGMENACCPSKSDGTPPDCCQIENTCCPSKSDSISPDCCQIENDYHHEDDSKTTVSPLKINFTSVRKSVPTFFFSNSPAIPSESQEVAVTFIQEDPIPLPPRLHFAWVQCWRL